jgi:methylmalonyl-CoA/ethylmalonyl-CoA epimerase
MFTRVNHIAIAVPDLEAAAARYRGLGMAVSPPQPLPEHGVTVVFVELDNTKIELLEPLGEASPIAAFLERQPSGGIHHLCFDVDDLAAAAQMAQANGIRLLGGGEPKIGAHGAPVVFAHPKDFQGTLVEFEEHHLKTSGDKQR